MEHFSVIAVLLLFFAFGLLSKRINNTIITPPMVFVAGGLLLGLTVLSAPGFGGAHLMIGHGPLHLLLEATLVLVLFTDAAGIKLDSLKRDSIIPHRMLVVGMPLTILLGGVLAYVLPLGLTICEAALIAAILTPTDAALGQAVVHGKKVPLRLRQSINIESGLNDGIALPIVLTLASIASAIATADAQNWLLFAAMQLTFGTLIGGLLGFGGARLLNAADARGWASEAGRGMLALVLAGLSFLIAESVHGNGFIAAFVSGLLFGNHLKRTCGVLFEFVETEGQLLTLSAFFLFGALLLPAALVEFNGWYWLFALCSLTWLRMLPIAISLGGVNLAVKDKLFLGWFGPRGLATLLFMLTVVSETRLEHGETITHIAFIAVLLSVFLHGASAAPLANRYDAQTAIRSN